MSYTPRRGGSGGYSTGPSSQSQQSVGNIGQRRPVVTNNFVPGQSNTQNKSQQQTNQQQKPPVQQQQQPQNQNTRNQQNQGYQQQQQQQQQAAPAPPPPPQQQHPVQQQQVKTEQPPTKMPQDPADINYPTDANDQQNMDTSEEVSSPRKKPFWAKGGVKISKKEKTRRRNVRLSKILQPKNAVMILHELAKNASYMVDEMPVIVDTNQFKATVSVDNIEHTGLGRSKIHAKNAAAEIALKYLIKTNKLSEMKMDEEGNEKMDVSEDDSQQTPLPWQHFASFALYKLFSSWGEDPNVVKAQTQLNSSGEKPFENKPSKKMPPNPETVNPLMLVNQMLPQAQFEEIGKSGNPPNVTYSFRCTVDGQSFIGTGPNKKAAKKLAAYGACHKVLNVTYPVDVYVPIH